MRVVVLPPHRSRSWCLAGYVLLAAGAALMMTGGFVVGEQLAALLLVRLAR